ncbi:hypothetical protein [Acinetobacter sp. D009]|uniref:hypothetical protein n=1 Tax=Acinetobacter sp. D009 TaxID=3138069 RepID=UPI003144D5D9
MNDSLKVDGFKKLRVIFYTELCIVIIINLTSMSMAYLLNGVKGVEKIVFSLGDLFDRTNLITILICIIIGSLLYGFFYLFAFKNKEMIKGVSDGLIDTSVALFRLTAGILIAFTILHSIVDGYRPSLISFLFHGLICILITTGIVGMKKHLFSRPVRPLK